MIFAVNCFFFVVSVPGEKNRSALLELSLDTQFRRNRCGFTSINGRQTVFVNVCLSIVLLALLGLSVEASSAPTKIRYALSSQSVFTTKMNAKGSVENPLIRVAAELFKRAKLDWESKQYPAARMFQKLTDGEANFSIIVNSPTLESCCIVGHIPVVTTELRVYHKKGAEPVLRAKDLIGKHVITLRGYSYGPLKSLITNPSNQVSVFPTATHATAFAMLAKERADYVLDYKHPSIEVLGKNPIKDIQFETLREINLYLVLNKNYPNAEDLLLKLEGIINKMDINAILELTPEPI